MSRKDKASHKAGATLGRIYYHGPMKKQLGFVLAVLSLAAAPAGAQTSPHDSSKPSGLGLAQAQAAQKAAPVSQLDGRLFYELLLGELSVQEGEPATGFALMLNAARRTGDAQLYQRATDIAAKRVVAGKVSPVEETRARVAEAGVRVTQTQADSELRNARRRLSSLWGNPAPKFSSVRFAQRLADNRLACHGQRKADPILRNAGNVGA